MSRAHPLPAAAWRILALTLTAVVGCADGGTTAPGPMPYTVTVTPETGVLAPGDVVLVDVTLRDDRGRVVTGPTFTLSTDDPTVAVMDGSGRIRAVAPGVTRLRASVPGLEGWARVEVGAAPRVLQLARYEGAVLPLLVHSETVEWNGVPEYHEVYVTGGSLSLTGSPQPRYEMAVRYEEFAVHWQGGQRVLVPRTTWNEYDRGVVGYDARGDLDMTSEYISPLKHRGAPSPGGLAVDFRTPGTDLRLDLFYRR